LTGANRVYILNHIPHISRIMVDSSAEVMDFAEVIVVGNGASEFRELLACPPPEKIIVDLVRISDRKSIEGSYDGICW
jgi:GDP-mannose 6-dehydrogenase